MIQRRKFLKQGLVTGAAGLISTSLFSNQFKKDKQFKKNPGEPFHLSYAIHHGMFRNNAGPDFTDQIKFAYDQGFRAIEDNGMTGRPAEEQQKIGDALSKLGMRMGVFVLDKGGNGANTLAAGKKEHTDIFLKGCK